MIALIVGSKLATLYELYTVYSLDDARGLYDIICTDNYNQYIVNKNVKSMVEQNESTGKR